MFSSNVHLFLENKRRTIKQIINLLSSMNCIISIGSVYKFSKMFFFNFTKYARFFQRKPHFHNFRLCKISPEHSCFLRPFLWFSKNDIAFHGKSNIFKLGTLPQKSWFLHLKRKQVLKFLVNKIFSPFIAAENKNYFIHRLQLMIWGLQKNFVCIWRNALWWQKSICLIKGISLTDVMLFSFISKSHCFSYKSNNNFYEFLAMHLIYHYLSCITKMEGSWQKTMLWWIVPCGPSHRTAKHKRPVRLSTVLWEPQR